MMDNIYITIINKLKRDIISTENTICLYNSMNKISYKFNLKKNAIDKYLIKNKYFYFM